LLFDNSIRRKGCADGAWFWFGVEISQVLVEQVKLAHPTFYVDRTFVRLMCVKPVNSLGHGEIGYFGVWFSAYRRDT